jgi:hypothetical protein
MIYLGAGSFIVKENGITFASACRVLFILCRWIVSFWGGIRNYELGVGSECKEDSKKEALWQKMVLDH